QLRQRGPPLAPDLAIGSFAPEHGAAGRLLTDPQPALTQHEVRDRCAVLRGGGPARTARVQVDEGAGQPTAVDLRERTVVRQQHRLPRAGGRRPAHVVGQGPGGRRPEPAPAREGLRLPARRL
ncbi:MAG: hypothetical protein AVDCRST_MAG60-47, partial [uncultured Nocardioides sp.]